MTEGILLLDKPAGITSFKLVAVLRKLLNVKKIGHTGTLDPFATGLMVMLVGRSMTKLSDQLMQKDKRYLATVCLGKETTTYDCDGDVTEESDQHPSTEELILALEKYQGSLLQTPPMYSAKKVGGKKLYTLARQGLEIERQQNPITLTTKLLSYTYPYVTLDIHCTKGTYIRSIANDLGRDLGCFAHLSALQRTEVGTFSLKEALSFEDLSQYPLSCYLKKHADLYFNRPGAKAC